MVRYGNEWGSEQVYRITTSDTTRITARLRPDYSPTSPGDPDVFLLSQLDTVACLPVGYGDMSATFTDAPAGTYYVAMDGWNGSYSLELTCSSGPTPTATAALKDQIYIPIILIDD